MSKEKGKSEKVSHDEILEGEIVNNAGTGVSEPAGTISQETYDQLAQELQQSQGYFHASKHTLTRT